MTLNITLDPARNRAAVSADRRAAASGDRDRACGGARGCPRRARWRRSLRWRAARWMRPMRCWRARVRSQTRGAAGTIVSGVDGARIEAVGAHAVHVRRRGRDRSRPARCRSRWVAGTGRFPRKLWSNLTVQAARATQPADLAYRGSRWIAGAAAGGRGLSGCCARHRCSPPGAGHRAAIRARWPWCAVCCCGPAIRCGWRTRATSWPARRWRPPAARLVPVRVDQRGIARRRPASPRRRERGWRWSRRRTNARPAWRCRCRGGWSCWPGRRRPSPWILEDDYDSEFRYVGRPLPSLKSLDRGRARALRGQLQQGAVSGAAARLSGGAAGAGGGLPAGSPAADAWASRCWSRGRRRVHAEGPFRPAYPPDADGCMRSGGEALAAGAAGGFGTGSRWRWQPAACICWRGFPTRLTTRSWSSARRRRAGALRAVTVGDCA